MPGRDVDVRSCARERLGDAGKRLRAVDQHVYLAAVPRRRRACTPQRPAFWRIELIQATDARKPAVMVIANQFLDSFTCPTVDALYRLRKHALGSTLRAPTNHCQRLPRSPPGRSSRPTAAWPEEQALGQRDGAELPYGGAHEQPRLQAREQRNELRTLALAERARPPVRLAGKRDQPPALGRIEPSEMLRRQPGELGDREHWSKPSGFPEGLERSFEGQASHA